MQMPLDPQLFDSLMATALEDAKVAQAEGEVPVGAVIYREGKLIARAHNLVERRQDVTAHAECLAIQKASRLVGNWRLSECLLAVTLEPCPMCMTAIRLARIPSLIFGTRDEVMGAAGSTLDLTDGVQVVGGIKREECAALLRGFFRKRR